MNILWEPLYDGFLVGHLVLLVAVLWVAGSILKRRRYREAGQSKYTVPIRCWGCGWEGRVGEFARKCPKCGASL
ncbi:MAG: hypothetical protein HZA23_04725 [Nitrospirae bacterium]|nr:hypothetical protein [Nitrospirota bacterium]